MYSQTNVYLQFISGCLVNIQSARYSRLSNVVSDDAAAQKNQIQDTVEKFTTYKDIKKLMGKLQNIWKNEASENRRAKQLKNYVDLFKGRLEIEEILKEKLGLPFSKDAPKIKELEDVLKWDQELQSLNKKLTEVEMKMPSGMSTRDERFRLGM